MTDGAMFILGEALTRTGVIDWIAHRFEKWAGGSLTRAIIILALIVIPLSAFMNNTPVVIVFCRALYGLRAQHRDEGQQTSHTIVVSYNSLVARSRS